jgi:exodeoxyribonuclease V alpha subunit
MTENQDSTIHIEGTVENVLYRNEINGYAVLDLNSDESLVTVVGELGDIEEGEMLALDGVYEQHQRFGSQFRAVYCERKLPSSLLSIRKYLESGAIRGIGPSLARRIVDVFGTDTLRVMEEEPEKLTTVKGISPKKCKQIANEAKKIFALRSISTYLSEYHIRPQYAMRAFQIYGHDALLMIKDNPYILCDERIELDFFKVEPMAKDLDISVNSEKRILAAIVNILRRNAQEGHTCLPLETVFEIAHKNLDIDEKNFYDVYNKALDDSELFQVVKKNKEYVYTPQYYNAEIFIADRIQVLLDFQNPDTVDYSKMIREQEEEQGIEYDDIQKSAIESALSKSVMILTGGPGTGKTTTLNAIISIYKKQGHTVLISAPTGRAAKRISEITGFEAKTIHRLLEVEYDRYGRLVFKHNENDPLPCDVIIIDEMSMVDVCLFESLLRAVRIGCKVVMVGDANQLPSVGAGNLLKDMISSKKIPVIFLKKIFRQAQKSLIVMNAHKILKGENPVLTDKTNDFFFFQRLDATSASNLVIDLVKNRLPKAYGYSSFDDIQVISPSRKGNLGIIELNKSLQEAVNPKSLQKAEYKTAMYTFREGDKVMQNKNNYDILWKKDGETGKGIFNGDIGRILQIDKRQHCAFIDFDGRIAPYTFQTLSQIELAYAVTVHKSQGSEFNVVIIPILDAFEKLCDRNLLYTAVTRSKKLLILVGSQNEIYKMVSNVKKNHRCTCLKYMLEVGTNAIEMEIDI